MIPRGCGAAGRLEFAFFCEFNAWQDAEKDSQQPHKVWRVGQDFHGRMMLIARTAAS
ncbi:MAG TPA: hypothetical protein VNJ52_00960 [Patescibacteria group bacterium]|nr:hypothetical protein [Patescibacteria group bacterium]